MDLSRLAIVSSSESMRVKEFDCCRESIEMLRNESG